MLNVFIEGGSHHSIILNPNPSKVSSNLVVLRLVNKTHSQYPGFLRDGAALLLQFCSPK